MKNKKIRLLKIAVAAMAVSAIAFTGCSSKEAADASAESTKATVDTADGTAGGTADGETVAEKSAKLIDATKYVLDAPFTEATWASTMDEIKKLEGTPASTYDSIYGGTTYVYDTSYEGHDGSIKYMFDDKDALMCVAFTYVPNDAKEVMSLYGVVHDNLVKQLGSSEYQASHDTNYGDVWYRDEGDVVVSCMVTDEQNSLQYSYLNPIVSKYQMENAANQ